ncbi:Werner Syndrome exonuclease [Salix suchowensis]|nr:Werner Syndrome exonuclease [Salix suchowensis]
MNSRQQETNNNSNLNCCPVLDWDQPLTDQELEAIDAIEASFQSSTPSSSSSSSTTVTASPSSSIIKKRHSSPQKDQEPPKIRRQLPDSIFSLSKPFLFSLSRSFSIMKKRHSSPQKDQEPPKIRRQLPDSIFSLSKPFSLFPCQGNVKMRYPAMKFGGQILYSRTSIDVEKAARELLQSLEAKKEEMDRVIIGFDIEWKPSFTKGVLPGKAAVMQICASNSLCHVMHIFHSGITRSLQFLLEDSTVVKAGIGIGGDRVKVFRDYNVSVKSVEDLSYLANQKLGGEPKTWGLQALTETLVCKELQKPNRIRLGNWEVDVLSKEQLQYAATDAFASWQLYQVLNSLPNAKDATDSISTELEVEST